MSSPILSNNTRQIASKTYIESAQHKELQNQYQEAMQKAEAGYLKLGTATKDDKDAMVKSLSEAWSSLTAIRKLSGNEGASFKDQSQQLARIAVLRGKCRWSADDMEMSRQVFSLSLQLARGNVDIIKSIPGIETENLENILTTLASPGHKNTFVSLEEELANTVSTEAIILKCEHADHAVAFAIADAAREMGSVYQNHDSYKVNENDLPAVKKRKADLFQNAIEIAEKAWGIINTPQTQWLLVLCKYNTGPRRLENRDPKDIQGRVQIYKDILDILATLEKGGNMSVELYQQRAQCFNMLARTLEGTASDADNYANIVKAADIALEYADK
jgi:hypothetical protein